ncbi:hypothetical protein A3715_00585 [Oleiphilus sp. HI0009]|uniref:hypothetical protein n=1 Tax=unclassified Oleiphilus TaxID=2631174 RepID=UPI0007C22A76|nr:MULTISPECIES: hypothetical protein [unclassified Oleiphilus]KZX82283.1 hypothetical protein A3715_00585 [Oleiphilus sp. HI0009]MCH2157232.1 hypothetical protein [Oleiphilaceae bacterium]KZY66696.1 hypothetical protein A3738_05885 [Oleiphilus sp. HI0066]KZY73107.1 hypothetical protein A3739_02975 [Oleiphilus sp. HI0067]KZZ57651.1 hypothetical protein A3762_09410 [Oleiphilus sp. HI0125]
MTTLSHHDIIKLNEKELVAALKSMSTNELEVHANNIMHDLGGDDYGTIMKLVMQTLEQDQHAGSDRFKTIQNVLRDNLPNKAHMSDIYERLASIVMLIIMQKYREILSTKKS